MAAKNLTREEIRRVRCPKCKAEPGEPCSGKRGANQKNHFLRMQLAQRTVFIEKDPGMTSNIPKAREELEKLARDLIFKGDPDTASQINSIINNYMIRASRSSAERRKGVLTEKSVEQIRKAAHDSHLSLEEIGKRYGATKEEVLKAMEKD